MSPSRPWLSAPVVEGRSVRLRPLLDGDVVRIVEACGDPSTRAWLGNLPDPYGEADARAFLEDTRERAASGSAVTWAIADPVDDRLVGVINIFDIRPIGAGEIGYWVHPDARGRGVATQASRLALRHGFVEVEDGGLGLHTIRAYAATGNEASARVLRAAGLRESGTARGNTVLAGGVVGDTIAFDIVAEELAAGS
jgi:RimJ/RimL family protein N-acetyltransferase